MAEIAIRSVPCTVCGCVCDDLALTVQSGRIVSVEKACWLAKPWFDSLSSPSAHFDPVEFEASCDHAASILNESRSPLIYGLSRSTTEGQRAAVALADRIGATIDTTASTGHAPSILALQQVGESTCTLGEVKLRADFVLFWGSDPVQTHPRHIERYCPNRPIFVVDSHETETSKRAGRFWNIPAEKQWEALTELRQRIRGLFTGPDEFGLAALAEKMKAAKFGIVFFGAGLTQAPQAMRTIEALLRLVMELNDFTRFYCRRMRRFGDVAGADSVLAWQTGYPFGVNFAAGYPRYNPGEFTGPEMLARKEIDACVLVGSDTARDLPPAALAHLHTIPVIRLDSPGVRSPVNAAVRFTTAIYGIHRPGTAYRLDEVPIPLPMILESNLPSDGDVLNAILKRVEFRG